jgi:hypothetical protein
MPAGPHAAERIREAAGNASMAGPIVTHPYFIGGQFHPELTGRPLRPQPMFMGLVAAAMRRKYAEQMPEMLRREPELNRWLKPLVQTPNHQRMGV